MSTANMPDDQSFNKWAHFCMPRLTTDAPR
jgi:hypothetical protein